MNLIAALPCTRTVDEQRDVELSLLHFLRKYNPSVYSVWCSHPQLDPEDAVLRGDEYVNAAEDETDTPAERVATWTRRQVAPEFAAAVPLLRRFHAAYVEREAGLIPGAAQSLYPSRPWLVYWALQAADMLGIVNALLEDVPASSMVELLLSCLVVAEEQQAVHDTAEKRADEVSLGRPVGPVAADDADNSARAPAKKKLPIVGFAGGPAHQSSHLVSSLAAVCALVILHSYVPCLHRLPRAAIKRWLLRVRTPEGGFCVQVGGESDVRASYAASVITTLLRLDEPSTFADKEEDSGHRTRGAGGDASDGGVRATYASLGLREEAYELSDCSDVRHTPVLTARTAQFVAIRQTHEGGFSCGMYASEAHGAYTQCALASLILMRQPQLVHQSRLRRWLSERQLAFEGGFNGRTNKLVDSCYSHWVGSSHVMLRVIESYARMLESDLSSRTDRQQRSALSAMGLTDESGRSVGSSRRRAPPLAREDRRLVDLSDEEELNPQQPFEAAVDDSVPAAANCLLAREVFLLDHAQLLDIASASCSDNDLWDAAESAELRKRDLLDRFMSADDRSQRECRARTQRRADLFLGLHRQECLIGKNLPWTEENITNELHHLSEDWRFANSISGDLYFNQVKLQQYVLRCCQSWEGGGGGLMDKPECNSDAYHTCYSLSGVSSAQSLQYITHAGNPTGSAYVQRAMTQKHYVPSKAENYGVVVGVEGPSVGADVTMLRSTNPMINIHRSRVVNALSAWGPKKFI